MDKYKIKTVDHFIAQYNLDDIGVEELFKKHNITDIEDIKYLTKSDLREIGLKTVGHRNKVYHAIKSMIKHEVSMIDFLEIFGNT